MPNWKKLIVSGSGGALTTLRLSGLSNQAEEATALMINGSDVVGTRELGSNAFNSTTIPSNNNQLDNGAGYTTNTGTLTGNGTSGRVPIYNGTTSFTTDSGFTYSSNKLGIDGTLTSNGVDIISNASTAGNLIIGDTAGNDGIIQMDLKVYADSKITITDDNTTVKDPILTGLSAQSSEATSLMVSTTGEVGTRELGSNAFNSTTIPTNNNQLSNGAGYITNSVTTLSSLTSVGTLTSLTVDDITINGSTISDSADLTLDIGGDINLDADGGDIVLKDGGTSFGRFKNDTSNLIIKSEILDKDIIFKGNDNGVEVTALTLDMSGAGLATFNAGINAGGAVNGVTRLTVDNIDINGNDIVAAGNLNLSFSGNLNLEGQSALASEATSLMIDSDGNVGTRELGSNAFNSTAFTTNTGTVTSVGTNTGLSGTVTTSGNLSLALGDLPDMTQAWVTSADEFIVLDSGVQKRKLSSEIFGSNAFSSQAIPSSISDFGESLSEAFTLSETNLSEFNNDLGSGVSLANGVDNRVVTATGASALNAEQYLTYTGGLLQIDASTGYGKLRVGYGTTSSPAIHFDDDTDTGISGASANMYFSIGAVSRMQLNVNGLRVDDAIGVNVAASTTDGRIDAGNDIVAYSTSDERLKENVKPIENALDKVSKIGGYEFDWKELTEEEKKTIHGNEGHDVGVIAQEIEKVLPEVVTERDSGYKAVKYEKIVPLLIESIKDLKAEIEELKRGR